MKITSNYHVREYKYSYDVPEGVLDDYDWLDDCEKLDGWIDYRGDWYHISDFMRYDDAYWNGIVHDTFFSGILIHIVGDSTYTIGWYLS